MVTTSEQANVEETYDDSSIQLMRPMSSGIIGLTNGLTYSPLESNRSSVAPNYLNFPTVGISNGYLSAISGITDFTAYNSYIHHITVSNNGAGNIAGALGGAGISNFSAPADGQGTRINVMRSIVLASNRFEIYSRQFR
jgi:hypothetical protein